MKIQTITLLSLLLTSPLSKAENYMLIMGGGGEPQGSKTIFDQSMGILGDKLKQSGNWKYEASFNGGHSETEAIMSSRFPAPQTPRTNFTSDSYKKMIEAYKARILLGEIREGDQLVIMVNTHGAENKPSEFGLENKVKTHKIAVTGGNATGPTNLNNLAGSELVSMDDLEELVKLTNAKGIKLGLIDLSCHSGHTMALKKNAPNTCVITATGPNHFGFAGGNSFGDNFMKHFKKGSTLESAFLNARAASDDAGFPMISTDESEAIFAEVYASISPYLYYYRPNEDKLTDYLLQNSKDCITCVREQQFQSLIRKIEQLKALGQGQNRGFNADELKRLLVEYKRQQDAMIEASRKVGYHTAAKEETFSTPVIQDGKKIRDFNLVYKWSDLISNTDPDKTIEVVRKYLREAKTPRDKAENQAALDTWIKIKARRDELVRQYPNLKEAEELSKQLIRNIQDNRQTAEKIALQERKFYDELYRQKQSLNVDDPCRKIVL